MPAVGLSEAVPYLIVHTLHCSVVTARVLRASRSTARSPTYHPKEHTTSSYGCACKNHKSVTDVDFSNQVAHDCASSHASCNPHWHLAYLQLLHLPAMVKAKTALTSLAISGIMVVVALTLCFQNKSIPVAIQPQEDDPLCALMLSRLT